MSLVSLFNGGQLESLVGKETNDGLLSFSNNENVGDSGGEGVVVGVLDVGNVETSWVFFDVLDDSYSSNIVTTGNQN